MKLPVYLFILIAFFALNSFSQQEEIADTILIHEVNLTDESNFKFEVDEIPNWVKPWKKRIYFKVRVNNPNDEPIIIQNPSTGDGGLVPCSFDPSKGVLMPGKSIDIFYAFIRPAQPMRKTYRFTVHYKNSKGEFENRIYQRGISGFIPKD